MEVMRNIGYCIDLNCSGVNAKDYNIYKSFMNFKIFSEDNLLKKLIKLHIIKL